MRLPSASLPPSSLIGQAGESACCVRKKSPSSHEWALLGDFQISHLHPDRQYYGNRSTPRTQGHLGGWRVTWPPIALAMSRMPEVVKSKVMSKRGLLWWSCSSSSFPRDAGLELLGMPDDWLNFTNTLQEPPKWRGVYL